MESKGPDETAHTQDDLDLGILRIFEDAFFAWQGQFNVGHD